MANKINTETSHKVDHLTRNFFNNLAVEWEKNHHPERDKILSLLSRLNFSGSERILDLGCGTGILFPFLAKLASKNARIIGIDFAENMAVEAVKKHNNRVQVVCGDIQNLPFPPNSIDLIVAFQVFPHVHDKKRALRQCWHVLRPGGELAIIHLQGSRELNAFHAEIGGEISNHKLPQASELKGMFESQHFVVDWCVDNSDEYFVRGSKILI